MDDYISREALLKAIASFEENYKGMLKGVAYIKFLIRDMPTVKAEPMKHGRWLDNGIVYTCSECNCSVPKNIFINGCDFEGCPYCFARME